MESDEGAQLLQICVPAIPRLMENGRVDLKASQAKIYFWLYIIRLGGVT